MITCKNYNLPDCFACENGYFRSCLLDDLLNMNLATGCNFLQNKELLGSSIHAYRNYLPQLRKAVEIRFPENLPFLDKILILK